MENNEYVRWNNEILSNLKQFEDTYNPLSRMLLNEVSDGQNILTSKIIESSYLIDSTWVDSILRYLDSLEDIVSDPDSINLDDKAILKKYKNNKDLVPLSYEKRFIKTLIEELYKFSTRRYTLIKDKTADFRKNRVEISSQFMRGFDEVKCDISLEIKGAKDKDTLEETLDIQKQKAKAVIERVASLKRSNFMKALDKTEELNDTVMKTNVLMNEPRYKDCYMMWLFLDRFKEEKELPVKERFNPLDNDYKSQLIWIIVLCYVIDTANNPLHKIEKDEDFKDLIDLKVEEKNNGINLGVVDSYSMASSSEPLEDRLLSRAEEMFLNYTSEGLSDKTSYKRMLKDMLELTTDTYKELYQIPDDSYATFKNNVYTDDLTMNVMVKDYESKITALKDAYKVKQADLEKMKKSIDKMEKNVSDYKQFIVEQKKKIKEQERIRKIEEKLKLQESKRKQKEKEALQIKKDKEVLKKRKEKEALKASKKNSKKKKKTE